MLCILLYLCVVCLERHHFNLLRHMYAAYALRIYVQLMKSALYSIQCMTTREITGALGGFFNGGANDKSFLLTDKEVEAVLDACTSSSSSSSSSSSNSGLKHVICMSLTGSQQQGQFQFGGQSSGSKVAAARSVEQAIQRRR
jgi:hypothetical protein